MPRIGMRIIKSAVAVFLCFFIYLLRGQGIPFYSAIAAVLCIQPYMENSVSAGVNRTIATLIGGFYGFLMLTAERYFITFPSEGIRYFVISAAIIPIIYSTVLLKKQSAAYLSCVVFMSVCVSHGGDVNPYLFAVNRVLDTLIGIFVALLVNAFHLPGRGCRDLLFVVNLEEALPMENGKISSYTKVNWNRLLAEGAKLSLVTDKMPAVFLPVLSGLHVSLPVIALSGAVVYDMEQATYLRTTPISKDVAVPLFAILAERGVNSFVQVVCRDTMCIYHGAEMNPGEEAFFERTKNLSHKNYIAKRWVYDEAYEPVCISVIDTRQRVQSLMERISANGIKLEAKEDQMLEGYLLLNIYSKEASIEEAILFLKEQCGALAVAVFAGLSENLGLVQEELWSFSAADGCEEGMQRTEAIVGEKKEDAAIKKIAAVFLKKERLYPKKAEKKR